MESHLNDNRALKRTNNVICIFALLNWSSRTQKLQQNVIKIYLEALLQPMLFGMFKLPDRAKTTLQ